MDLLDGFIPAAALKPAGVQIGCSSSFDFVRIKLERHAHAWHHLKPNG